MKTPRVSSAATATSVDSDATKTLLDAFDEGDGMIPINHFLDAALAQVAE